MKLTAARHLGFARPQVKAGRSSLFAVVRQLGIMLALRARYNI
jgi:hypothetical protein